MPLVFRNDGYSLFCRRPPMTRETLVEENIDPLADAGVDYLVWGVGPASVLTYDTRVGDVVGDALSEEQWQLCRRIDRWAHENVRGLIDAGDDPLRVAVERGHELGMKVLARYQMNHEYGPADPENWKWVLLVGSFNKQHPEYRIPGPTTHLDFKHQEVREFKLAIVREVAEKGVDGLLLDFCVYPPHMEQPDAAVITRFMRDARSVLDEVGRAQGRDIELVASVPDQGALELGLDWRAWMRKGLTDVILPVRLLGAWQRFDVPIDEFVAVGEETGCDVWGFSWFTLQIGGHDPEPGGYKPPGFYPAKPKNREMFNAQALLLHRAGVDAIQFMMPKADLEEPWVSDLADPSALLFADKHYMVDLVPHLPLRFPVPDEAPFTSERVVPIRIADDIQQARARGHSVDAALLFHSRGLREGERLSIYINDEGPRVIVGGSAEEMDKQVPFDFVSNRTPSPPVVERNWWRRGEHSVAFPAEWLELGENTIRMTYATEAPDANPDFWSSFIEVLLDYD